MVVAFNAWLVHANCMTKYALHEAAAGRENVEGLFAIQIIKVNFHMSRKKR